MRERSFDVFDYYLIIKKIIKKLKVKKERYNITMSSELAFKI